MKKIILDIEGMTCSACSNGLEKYLKKQKGITDAYVNLIMATAMIEYDETLQISDIEKFIEEAGFKSLGEKREEKQNQKSLKFLILFAVLGITVAVILWDMVLSSVDIIMGDEAESCIFSLFTNSVLKDVLVISTCSSRAGSSVPVSVQDVIVKHIATSNNTLITLSDNFFLFI